jgi:SAM-dependent methyltransferase
LKKSLQIQTQTRENCFLCDLAGQPLYHSLSDRLYGISGEWNYLQCPGCHLAWLSPMPVREDIPKLYLCYYTHAPQISVPSTLSRVREAVQRNGLVRRFLIALLKWDVLNLPSAPSFWDALWLKDDRSGKCLDIGCGDGSFLKVLQDLGWDVVGVEPDAGAAEIARDYFDVDVRVGTLEDAGLPAGVFDIVRLNHVIEHLYDPLGTLHECYRVLKPGGRLLFYTPNVLGLGHNWVFRDAWLHLDPPRHLNLFSRQAVSRIVEQAGFSVESIRSISRGASHTSKTSWKIRQVGTLPRNWRDGLPWRVHLLAVIVHALEILFGRIADVGEELQILAVKS